MIDRSLREWVVEHRVDALDPLFVTLTYAGSLGLMWLVLAFAISAATRRPPWLVVQVAVTIAAAELVSGLLKLVIDRDRPPIEFPDPEPIVDLPATASLPSGHATVAFACATVLALSLRRFAVAFFVLAALVAFSRVYVGVHFPFDTLAGAALGVVLGLASIALRRPLAARRRSPRTPPAG